LANRGEKTTINIDKSLEILYMNVRSLSNKIHRLELLLSETEPDIAVLSETWTSDKITNPSISLNNYEIVSRSDRTNTKDGRGGGVIIYAKNEISSKIQNKPPNSTIMDIQVCEIKICDVTIVGVYRSPTTNNDSDMKLINYLKDVPDMTTVVGDFNLPRVDWSNPLCTPNHLQAYNDIIMEKFWDQLVEVPTHLAGNTLDIVLADRNLIQGQVEVCPELKLPKMDHFPIKYKINMKRTPPITSEVVYNYSKANFECYRQTLAAINWQVILSRKSVEGMWHEIKSKIIIAADGSIPKMNRRKRRDPPWMTRDLKRLLNQRKRAWKIVKKYDSYTNREKHKVISTTIDKMVDTCKVQYEHRLGSTGPDHQKHFYSYMRQATKAKDTIGPLSTDDGLSTENDIQCAELLNNYFGSVFGESEPEFIPQQNPSIPVDGLEAIYFGPGDVVKMINKLKNCSSPGPDCISSRLLKEGVGQLAEPLAVLFNMSFQSGIVPAEWKTANVSPIFKSGDKSKPSNYRPISLTSQVCKVMERVINEKMKNYIARKNVISKDQYGFMPGLSTKTNLLTFWNKVTARLESNESCDVVYFDFAKAFDTVPHGPLIHKLEKNGITGRLLIWIKNWLSDRTQRVVLNGSSSEYCNVTSSVPQGSVLGPTLFLIYINDLCDEVGCESFLFADDTKIVQPVNNDSDRQKLQQNIDNMYRWSVKWKMKFNPSKCAVLHFGYSNKQHHYHLHDQPIESMGFQKDLGVTVNTNGRFVGHVNNIAKKANRLVGMVKRRLHSHQPEILKKIYNLYILPTLTYNSEVWNPVYRNQVDHLEKVQRRYTRLLNTSDEYDDRLKTLNLQTLESVRDQADLKLMHQMYHNKSALQFGDFFQLSDELRTRGGSENVIRTKTSKKNIRRHSFSDRLVITWNTIPLHIRKSNRSNFNSHLTKYNISRANNML
jgi:hypothetical protein